MQLASLHTASAFEQFLQAASAEAEPQRMLFVFAAAELPDDATPEQLAGFSAGCGGTLTPLMCVDKSPADLAGFAELAAEASEAGPPWDVVFAAGLSGRGGRPPSAEQVQRALDTMVEYVRIGRIGSLLALDRSGQGLQFT